MIVGVVNDSDDVFTCLLWVMFLRVVGGASENGRAMHSRSLTIWLLCMCGCCR